MITVDDSLWPLVKVDFVGSNTLQDLESYLTSMDRCVQRGDRYLAIFDTLRLTTAPSMELRKRQIEWLTKNDALLRQRCLGNAFVITSPFIRLALSIMYQLQPPPMPYTVVGDLKTAQDWVSRRLQAAGLSLPLAASRQGVGGVGRAW